MNDEPTNMPPKNLPDKIMQRIEQERLAPEPRWHFKLKNILFWTLWIFSILAGAAAVSATLFVVLNSGWEYSNFTHRDILSFIADSAPLLWLATFSLMLFAGFINFRLTTRGYRYPLFTIIGLGLLSSLMLGTVLFGFGIGDLLERRLGPHIPMHQPIMAMQKDAWQHPKQGLLAGEVDTLAEDSAKFTMRAYDGKTWTVLTENLSDRELDILKNFKDIRIIGVADQNENTFRACRILPWKLRGRAPFLPGPERPFPLPLEQPTPPTSTDERDLEMKRNTECEGVRPYKLFRQQFDSPSNPNNSI